ncbi:hypothetical protein L7F22_065318 [Adiantum nelumboides]|nr:hypothetical protein [Adiantum nelumboides]
MSSATSTSNIEVSKVLMRDIKQSTMLKFGNVTQISKRQRVHDGGAPLCIDAMDDELEEGEEPDSSSKKGERRALWQDDWLQSFKWLVYDNERVRLFCSFCLDYPHSKTFFIGKNSLPFALYPSLLSLMKETGVKCMTSLYNDDKACTEIIQCLAKSIMDETLAKVRESPWFGVMVDESTDIAIHHHMVVYISYLEKGCVPCTLFYGMIRTHDSSAQGIYATLMLEMEKANLDITKLTAFGSDGCSTMVGRKKGVATLLKQMNPRLTSIHCVAHRTNLATSDTSKKVPYAKQVDQLINAIANHFSSSSHRMENLKEIQEELDCEVLKMQRIFEIRWLSRHACVAKICKSLDALLVALAKDRQDLYNVLCTFECIYVLHFLADILEKVSDLSKRFQKDYVDVTTIHGIVQSTILCIKDDYLEERNVDLNASQKGVGDFPIMPEYGSENGFLHALRSSLRGDMFFEKRFVDNSILRCLKIMVPAQHPIHEKALKDFGMSECAEIVCFYGEEKNVDGKIYAPLIDGNSFKDEFRKFKRQAAIDFAKMGLCHVTSLLASNDSLKDMYPNVLKVAQIALVQCCSTAVCERGFSSRTKIKNKWRNRLEIESLDALLVISIEGDEGMDFSNAMDIWKKLARRHLFAANGSTTIDV